MKFIFLLIINLLSFIFLLFYYTPIYNPLFSNLIDYKIEHNFFEFKKGNYDYDLFLLQNEYSFYKINKLIKNRPESDFYYLMKFLYDDDKTFLDTTDIYIIDSLRFFLSKEKYKEEFKKQNKNKINLIIERVKLINTKKNINNVNYYSNYFENVNYIREHNNEIQDVNYTYIYKDFILYNLNKIINQSYKDNPNKNSDITEYNTNQ